MLQSHPSVMTSRSVLSSDSLAQSPVIFLCKLRSILFCVQHHYDTEICDILSLGNSVS